MLDKILPNQLITAEHRTRSLTLLPLFHYRPLVYNKVKGACACMNECTGAGLVKMFLIQCAGAV